MSFHQVQAGTQVTVRSTGNAGSIKKVYYFPTMYKVELDNGTVEKFTTHEIEIEGTSLDKPGIIDETTSKILSSGKSYELSLFNVKTVVEPLANLNPPAARPVKSNEATGTVDVLESSIASTDPNNVEPL